MAVQAFAAELDAREILSTSQELVDTANCDNMGGRSKTKAGSAAAAKARGKAAGSRQNQTVPRLWLPSVAPVGMCCWCGPNRLSELETGPSLQDMMGPGEERVCTAVSGRRHSKCSIRLSEGMFTGNEDTGAAAAADTGSESAAWWLDEPTWIEHSCETVSAT